MALAKSLKTQIIVLGGALGVLWLVFALNTLDGGGLMGYGIVPRTELGLRGIVFAPFLHANRAHLAANSVPFLILGWLVMLRNARHFWAVTVAAMLGSGVVAWTIGAPDTVHIGASGVIFGYLGFLMLSGWFARRFWSIALSLAVTLLRGGLVLGVMPGQPGVSWQAHLGGFAGGVIAARQFRSTSR